MEKHLKNKMKKITKKDFELIIEKSKKLIDSDIEAGLSWNGKEEKEFIANQCFILAQKMVSDENDRWQEFHDKRIKEERNVADYWKNEFLKVTKHWYNGAGANMSEKEFIATKERKSRKKIKK